MAQSNPSFNLWTEPWITAEQPDGALETLGIDATLLRAHEFRATYDPSPLVIAGVHRLLTAILQDTLAPERPADLARVWQAGRFQEADVRAFGDRYAHRFDIFSPDEPFLQCADLPPQPPKSSNLKSTTYLMPQLPAGSEVTHYYHGVAEDNIFCPACAALGLITVPAFATSGGAGIKPSINGVPPIYVLPGGKTLFESLTASLVLPDYQPEAASTREDAVWWRREPVIEHKAVVHEVSYLHSLTFPARRVRLYPEPLREDCSRCGRESAWGVRTMIYQMGESRPKDAPFWRDPFAAYRIRDDGAPVPIRPQEGKALWREFAALFLPSKSDEGNKERTVPPSALYQRAEFAAGGIGPDYYILPFRCIGMRTDMKAKVFEWIDAGFDVPVDLIHDLEIADEVRQAIDFATECAGIISGTFRSAFGGEGKTERHATLRRRMLDAFWTVLTTPFRTFVLAVAVPERREAAFRTWVDTVVDEAKRAFKTHSEAIGNDAIALRERVAGQRNCGFRLNEKRKKAIGDAESVTQDNKE
jgi:CRISPR system Cascade subunit CasA